MFKQLVKSLVCAVTVMAIAASAPVTISISADDEKELYNFRFDNEAEQGEYFKGEESITMEWVSGDGIGHDDNNSVKVIHTEGKSYSSFANALILKLPEALPAGGVYRITAWVYVPSEGNEDKETLTGPGFVINEDYGGNQGVVKFPTDFGVMPVNEWKKIDVTIPLQDAPIERLDFRFVINDAPNHPDVWYWDNIEIYQVGELEKVVIPEWDPSLPSLYEAYEEYFLFGNILEPNQMNDEATAEMFKNHYNAMTAGNSMKPSSLTRQKDVYNFSGADAMISWAHENNIVVHGHTLVWHEQSPDWLYKNADGTPLTRDEAKTNLENYITEVAGHFKGQVISWDVVNEALNPGTSADWRVSLRMDSPWYKAYENGADTENGESGADYIYDAFVFARLADPYALLYYLDYNEETAGKREAMAQMTEDLNEKWKSDPRNSEPDRLLIEGLGLQAHYWTDSLKPADVEATINRFIQTGVRLSIAELDIPFDSYGTFKNRTTPPTKEEQAYQDDLYRQLFGIFKNYSEYIDRVTIWGLADTLSWRGAGYPVLFDKNYQPKSSFQAVLDAASNTSNPSATTDTEEVVDDSADITEEQGLDTSDDDAVEASASAAESAESFPVLPIIIIAVIAGIGIIVLIVLLVLKSTGKKGK